MNIKENLECGKRVLLEHEIEDYGLVAAKIAEYVFKIKKDLLLAYSDTEIDDLDAMSYRSAINKAAEGVPLQYIINKQEFMGLDFYVDENVLIPQPDTEILVEEVINTYKNKKCKVLDLCTGSGAIGVSIAKYVEEADVVVSDISEKAIQIAKLNAEKNNVHKKMIFIESDMFQNIDINEFDVIISNPPYIKTGVIKSLSKQVQNEPSIALDGGNDGLFFYKIIAKNAKKYLKKDGKLFLEIGYDQKNEVIELLKNNSFRNVYCLKDLGGNDRAIIADN